MLQLVPASCGGPRLVKQSNYYYAKGMQGQGFIKIVKNNPLLFIFQIFVPRAKHEPSLPCKQLVIFSVCGIEHFSFVDLFKIFCIATQGSICLINLERKNREISGLHFLIFTAWKMLWMPFDFDREKTEHLFWKFGRPWGAILPFNHFM